ncbi:MAG: putative Ig domain-containing protein [Verrucomicrobia bacterium]|nr:putative Ig domain-containing protein [Verrucomicrobiota bacterium]
MKKDLCFPLLKCLLATFCLPCGMNLQAQSIGEEGLGLKPPTLAEQAEAARTMVRTKKVLPNKLALERLNAERLAKGLPRVLKTPPARMGEEVVALGAAEAPLLGSGSSGSGEILANLPGRVDNSALPSFPPIRNQGSIGSCASFSSTYTVATHMLGLVRGTNSRSATANSTKLSPKFIYALVNEGQDAGSTIIENFNALISFGAPYWSSWPYVGDGTNSKNYLEWPLTAEVWREAAKNRLYQSGSVQNIDTTTGLQNLKALLANGYLLVFGTDIYGWQFTSFSNDPATNLDNDLAGKKVCWKVMRDPSGHAMTIVGYDDNVWTDIDRDGVVDSGEKGALKIANSWGTNWEDGEAGFVWIAYDALRDTSQVSGVSNTGRASGIYSPFYLDEVYWVSALEGYSPTLLGEFTVSHASRSQMRVRFGRALPPSATTPEIYSAKSDLNGLGGAYAFDGGVSPKDGTFVFDFTDLQQSGARRYFVSMSDTAGGASGFLKAFRLTSPSGAALAIASNGLGAAVDGITRHAYVDYGGTSAAPVITSATSATARVGQSFSYTIAASGSPSSYAATGLPAGLQVASSNITGTPTHSGSYNVALSATNDSGTGTATLRLEVAPAFDIAPVITSNSSASGQVGVPFNYNITASGTVVSYGAAGLPNGLGVNATSGLVSGTPTQAGISAVSLSATNQGGTGTRSLTLSISQASTALPEITSQTAAQGASGSQFLYRIEATNSPTSYGAEGLPSGLSLNATTGVITGTLPSPRVYSIMLTATNAQGTASKTLALTVTGGAIQGPSNDDFANRVPLAGVNATATGSNVNASAESGEPNHLGQRSHSVWWTWTAPRTASVVVSLTGSSFDTVLGVYSGSSVGSLSLVAENDDASSTSTSQVTFNATVGTDYQIAVDGYGADQGQIKLSIIQTAGGAVANDAFANAETLAGASASATGSNYDATAQVGEAAHAGQVATKSIWWKWTAPGNGSCTVDTIGSTFDTVLAVYTGASVSSLAPIASDDQSGGSNTSKVSFITTTGTTYFFAVDGRSGAGGAVALQLEFSSQSKPANDDFLNAIALVGSSANGTANSAGATAEASEPSHYGNPAEKSLWWTWTASQSGPVRISTAGSAFDTVLAVYSGSSIYSLAEVASNDDANGDRQSAVEFEAVSGTIYRIAVDGYDGASGAVALAVAQSDAPQNDDFANAQALNTVDSNFASASGSSRKATAESGEPAHAGSNASRSLWWSWTAPHSGAVTIDTAGSGFDTVLAVYNGTNINSLSEVASNDDNGSFNTSSVTFQAVGGTNYRIALDGYSGRSGQYELSVEQMEEGSIYETDFEYFPEGFNTIDGFDGWSSSDNDPESGTFGIFEAEEGNLAAWVGYNSTNRPQVAVYRSVDVSASVGVVEFSVDLWIQDSTSNNYDNFRFEVWNRNEEFLGCIEFDNERKSVFRGDGSGLVNTGNEFKNGVSYSLSATLNLEQQTWTAYLGDQRLFADQPITQTQRVVDLGSIDAVWQIRQQGNPGDNFMVFDNYRIATSKLVPVITSSGQKQAAAGEDFEYQIEATHSPEEYDVINRPEWLTCNSATGRISGSPPTSGTSQITLTAKNSAGTGTKLLLLSVAPSAVEAPVITSTTSASAKVGTPFTYQIAATNAPTSYNATISGGSLPAGLSINTETGFLSGTPTAAGNFTITLTAANSGGNGQTTLMLVVTKAVPTITVLPTASGITAGQSLQSSELSGGSASIPGTFAFTTPFNVPAAGESTQSITFTPSDGSNYTTVSSNVIVVVSDPPPTPVPAPAPQPSSGGVAPSGGGSPAVEKAKKGGKGKSTSAKKAGGGSKKSPASKSSGGKKSSGKKGKKK